ncbi:hypothetical protein QN357_11305, partial [Cryobacterium sp. RTC2.1]|uniref:hypothetical protein n=1 Tax=unclassified Cryobacterium TaxID=2649013 RepID=UPI002B225EF1
LCWVFLGHIRILSPERKRQENRDGSLTRKGNRERFSTRGEPKFLASPAAAWIDAPTSTIQAEQAK